MRQATKLSLFQLLAAIAVYLAGFYVLPGELVSTQDYVVTGFFAVLYFLVLPLLYWRWVIKIGNKKAWRILIAFSLGCFAARYTFPSDIASYFEFIVWLRYPFIAVIVVIELVLIVSIVRGLWQARHLSGDPRIGVFDAYKDKKPEHQDLALLFSYEPATWYYAIAYLSRKHVEPMASLNLRSAKVWSLVLTIILLLSASALSYYVLLPVNEILAIVTSAYLAYGITMAVANYRISRRYSVYISRDNLVVNGNFLNLLPIKLSGIDSVQSGEWPKTKDDSILFVGAGDRFNVEFRLKEPQMYYGLMGMITEPVSQVRLSVRDPESFVEQLTSSLKLPDQ